MRSRDCRGLTSEGIALYDESAEPSLAGIDDVRDAAERAALGASLRIEDLHRIARSVNVALAAREALATSAVAKQLRALLEPVDPALAPVASCDRLRRRGGRLRLARQRVAVAPEASRGAAQRTSPSSRGADAARALELASRFPAGDIRHRARRPTGARGEDRRAQQGAGHRARRVELRTDALRRAVRGRRAQQPARRGGGRRAGGGRADRPRALGAGRRPRRRSCGARRGDRRGRPRARSRRALAPLARRGGSRDRRVRLVGARHPLLDPRDGGADRPRPRRTARARRQRARTPAARRSR